MIELGCRILNAGLNVFRFQIGVIGKNLGFGNSGGQQIQHVFNPNAHTPDT